MTSAPRGRGWEEEPPARRKTPRTRHAAPPPLVARVQNGSRQAFCELVRLFADRVYALALARTGDVAAARDATREALLLAPAEVGTLTDANQVPGFLADLVDRTAGPPGGGGGSGEAEGGGPSGDAWLARVMALPRDEERAATLLSLVAGASEEQIGQLLRIPVATVENRLATSRKRLKRRGWREVSPRATAALPSNEEGFAEEIAERALGE